MYPYIQVFGIHIPTYGLCICIAVFVCAILVFKKAHKINIDFNDLLILMAVSVGGAIFGSSLLYIVVTYDFETLYKQIVDGNFLFFKNQGTVFYGGLIGGVLGAIVTAKIMKMKIEDVERCVVPYIPFGHSIGRIGCLLAGCCYGFPYNGIFAISTRFDSGKGTYFPIQAIEVLLNLLIMASLLLYAKRKRPKYSITCLYLIMYSCSRFFLEFFRGDDIRGSFLVFSTSQWISVVIILFSLVFIIKNKITKSTAYKM